MRLLGIVVMLLLCSMPAQAQDTATKVFAVTAFADWATTATFLSRGQAVEGNVLLQWTDNQPALTVAAGAAMDVASVYAWNRWVGRRHRKLATIGLYAASAYRVWLVSRGMKVLNGGRL